MQCPQCGREPWQLSRQRRLQWEAQVAAFNADDTTSLCPLCIDQWMRATRPRPARRCLVCAKRLKHDQPDRARTAPTKATGPSNCSGRTRNCDPVLRTTAELDTDIVYECKCGYSYYFGDRPLVLEVLQVDRDHWIERQQARS